MKKSLIVIVAFIFAICAVQVINAVPVSASDKPAVTAPADEAAPAATDEAIEKEDEAAPAEEVKEGEAAEGEQEAAEGEAKPKTE